MSSPVLTPCARAMVHSESPLRTVTVLVPSAACVAGAGAGAALASLVVALPERGMISFWPIWSRWLMS